MMFAPFILALAFAFLAFMVITFVFGLVLCVRAFSQRRSAILGIIGVVMMTFSGVILAGVLQGDTRPPAAQARSLMNIPAEAQVKSVTFGDWAGDGKVVFKLPVNRPAALWFEDIWRMNRVGGPDNLTKSDPPPQGIERAELVNEDWRSLEYDPATQLYTYEVRLSL